MGRERLWICSTAGTQMFPLALERTASSQGSGIAEMLSHTPKDPNCTAISFLLGLLVGTAGGGEVGSAWQAESSV